MTDPEQTGVERSDLPQEVGESKGINGHKVVLKDPDGRRTKKYHCTRCGVWRTSGIHFDKQCVVGAPSEQAGIPQSIDELPGHVVRHKETGERYVVEKVEDGEIFVQPIDDGVHDTTGDRDE